MRHHFGFLLFVYFHYRLQDFEIVIKFGSCFFQSLYVFRETTAAVANTCKQKTLTDAAIRANSSTNRINVCPRYFAKISDFVHKSNLHCQESIGCILGHFCRTLIHKNYRISLTHQRSVEFLHYFFGILRFRADNHTVGFHKIFNGNTFTQKLRI